MDTKIQDIVFEYIDAIAVKLGVASEYVYGILVKQAVVSGIVNATVLTLLPILFAVATIFCSKKVDWKADDPKNDLEEAFGITTILLGIGFLIMFIIFVLFAPNQYIKIFNPEYFALKEILDTIKK